MLPGGGMATLLNVSTLNPTTTAPLSSPTEPPVRLDRLQLWIDLLVGLEPG